VYKNYFQNILRRLQPMDIKDFKEKIVVNVYYINRDKKVPLHKHTEHDEVFYCVKGKGYGLFEDEEIPLEIGKAFIVPAGRMHALRSDDELYISSFLIPLGCDLEPPKEKKEKSDDMKNRCSEEKDEKEHSEDDKDSGDDRGNQDTANGEKP
jgi:quercetin dioxygenase-like cupin family protein